MKRLCCFIVTIALLAGAVLGGCAPAFDKSPDKYSGIKWVTPDYSFRFNPSDDCKGNYNFNGTKYNIQVKFDGSHVSVTDADKNKELFYGDWLYEDDKHLYIHSITVNTDDFEELKENYSEFYRLNQEKIGQ